MSNNINFNNRAGLNPLLRWLWDLLAFFSADEITVPNDYHSQVREIQLLLKSDTSGLVNSLLDFAINSALVDYTIETSNANLTKELNQWIKSINYELIGRVPNGLQALAKEYFRERWKGSSLLLLRTTWEKIDGFELPTRMWFVEGSNLEVFDSNDSRVIGEEVYRLRLAKNKTKLLPSGQNEMIFVQKPFDSWDSLYSTPFIIQRGLYKNLKLLELINKKGEKIIGKAIEYMLLLKKGSEQLAASNNPDFIYSEEDLKKVRDNFKSFVANTKTDPGTPTHVTNFDTEFEHIIPDFTKAIKQELYSPIEKRILAGLGLVEVIEGVAASNRRESIMNPKPFITEIRAGISDFKSLLNDIVQTIIDKNSTKHRKYFASDIKIYASPVKNFISEDIRNHIRSMYDRGVISKQTYIEVAGDNLYFDIEVQRRKDEFDEGVEDILYPPIINNVEGKTERNSNNKPKDNVPVDKKGLEKKNYKGSFYLSAICNKCNSEFDYQINPEESSENTVCPSCGEELKEEDIELHKIFEEAPYKNITELPEQVKVLPSDGQKLWMRVFNQSYPKGEDYARKVAWSVVKKIYKKDSDKWVKKSKVKSSEGNWIDLEKASIEDIINIILEKEV